jgi:tRNA (guanosine-2'-O-)-methyltransferase
LIHHPFQLARAAANVRIIPVKNEKILSQFFLFTLGKNLPHVVPFKVLIFATLYLYPERGNRWLIQPFPSYLADMTPERTQRIQSVLSNRQNDLTVVLENVFDPHNISAVMRSCDAVGVQEIFVLNTRIPRHKKWGSRSSSSAAKWLTIHQYDNAAECFAELRKKYTTILTTHLSSGAVSLYDISFSGKLALVFGNEHAGVSDEIRGMADGNFVIPQVGMIRSLNISVACAVTLYEAFRQKTAAGHYQQQKLQQNQYIELSRQWGMYEKASSNNCADDSTGSSE